MSAAVYAARLEGARREQRQHGAFLAEHAADQGVDGDQQRELCGVGPQPQGQRSAAAGRRGGGCRHGPEVSGVPCASAHSSGPPTSTATSARPARSSRLPAVIARSPCPHITTVASVRTSRGAGRKLAELDVARRGNVPGVELRGLPHVHQGGAGDFAGMHQPCARDAESSHDSGGDAADQVADEVVVADLRCLPRDLGGVLVLVAYDDERAVGRGDPAEPGGERVPQRDRQGSGDVRRCEGNDGSHVEEDPAPVHQLAGRGRADRLQVGRRTEKGGPAAVPLAEVVEVAGIGAQRGEQRGDERVLVSGPQQRVGRPFLADAAGPLGPGWCGAERAGAVGGPQRDVVGQGEQALHRAVLAAGQLLGAGRVDQVGAGGGADDEGPAGEHPDRCVAVEEQVGEVLVGVAGGGEGAQSEPAEVDLVAVAQPDVVELAAAGGGGEDGRAVGGGEVEGAGEEVGVQVGLGRERDAETGRGGHLPEAAQVAAGVDGQRPAVAEVDQVGAVPEPLVDHGDQGRSTHGPSTSHSSRRRLNSAPVRLGWSSERLNR